MHPNFFLVLLALGIGGFAAHHFQKNQISAKAGDQNRISQLETENRAHQISEIFAGLVNQRVSDLDQKPIPPEAVLQLVDSDTVEKIWGEFPVRIKLSDPHWGLESHSGDWKLLPVANENYLALPTTETKVSAMVGALLPPGNYFLVWKIDLPALLTSLSHLKNKLFLTTNEASWVFSNSAAITAENYRSLSVLKTFRASPNPLREIAAKSTSGFFSAIPGSNLVLFSPATSAGQETEDANFPFEIVATGIFVAGLAFFFGRRRIPSPEISKAEALSSVSSISQPATDFFLTSESHLDSALEVAFAYLPAQSSGGDWYNYFHNAASGETVFVMADVSGRGENSSRFAAVIAGAFEDFRSRSNSPNPAAEGPEEFIHRINRVLLKMGRGKFHASLLVAVFSADKSQIRFLNCGYPFPRIVSQGPEKRTVVPIALASDFAGLSLDFTPTVKTVDFPLGATLVMHSNALFESRPEDRTYRERRFVKTCLTPEIISAAHLVSAIKSDWEKHHSGQPPHDDLSLLAVSAAA